MSKPPKPPAQIDDLPIFPMPDAVLFPGTVIPLHIADEPHRQLISDVLKTDKTLAVVMIQPGQHEAMQPPVCDVGCIGSIIHVDTQPDGQYHILLQGLQRVRLLEELPLTQTYRRFRARLIPHPTELALQQATRELAQMQSCVLSLRACVETSDQQLADVLRATADPLKLMDILSAILISDNTLQQRLLATADLTTRLRVLNDALIDAMLRYGRPPKLFS